MRDYDMFAIQTRLLAELINPSWGEMNHMNGVWSLEFDMEIDTPFILQIYLGDDSLKYRVSALFLICKEATKAEGEKWSQGMSLDRVVEEGEITSYQQLDGLLSPEDTPIERWERLSREWFDHHGFTDQDIWLGFSLNNEDARSTTSELTL